jgi:hypothetical protein
MLPLYALIRVTEIAAMLHTIMGIGPGRFGTGCQSGTCRRGCGQGKKWKVYIRQALDEAAQQNIRGKDTYPLPFTIYCYTYKRRKPSGPISLSYLTMLNWVQKLQWHLRLG